MIQSHIHPLQFESLDMKQLLDFVSSCQINVLPGLRTQMLQYWEPWSLRPWKLSTAEGGVTPITTNLLPWGKAKQLLQSAAC